MIFIAHEESISGNPYLTSVTYGGQTMTKVIEVNAVSSGYGNYAAAYILDEAGVAADAFGAWKLKVVDSANADVGTIDNWTLSLTYPAQVCGPHAKYSSHALVLDSCSAGGAGNNDTRWDPGESRNVSTRARRSSAVASGRRRNPQRRSLRYRHPSLAARAKCTR